MKDLLTNIQSRGKPVADIEQGYISTTACILANLSDKLGRSITWDHATGKVVGDAEANALAHAALSGPVGAPYLVVTTYELRITVRNFADCEAPPRLEIGP